MVGIHTNGSYKADAIDPKTEVGSMRLEDSTGRTVGAKINVAYSLRGSRTKLQVSGVSPVISPDAKKQAPLSRKLHCSFSSSNK